MLLFMYEFHICKMDLFNYILIILNKSVQKKIIKLENKPEDYRMQWKKVKIGNSTASL